MPQSRRASRSARGGAEPSAEPLVDADFLESATSTLESYTSSVDENMPIPAQRTIDILPRSQLAVPYPAALLPAPQSTARCGSTAPTGPATPPRRPNRPRTSYFTEDIDQSSPSPSSNPNETSLFPIPAEAQLPPPAARDSLLVSPPRASTRRAPEQLNPSAADGRRGSVAPAVTAERRGSSFPPRRESVAAGAHPPPPVSLQTRRRQSLAARRASHGPADRALGRHHTVSTTDGYNTGDQDVFTERSSALSDTASIASGTVEYPDVDGEFRDPFATPRRGSVEDGHDEQKKQEQAQSQTQINNREFIQTVANRISTRSSKLSPFAPARHPRRDSDQLDPHTSPKKDRSKYSPAKYSPQKKSSTERPGHRRNYSRPFTSGSESGSVDIGASISGSISGEQDDKITERHAQFDPMVDPSCTFAAGRHESQSSQPDVQAKPQIDAAEELKLNDKEQMPRRKSLCVLFNRGTSIYGVEEEKEGRAIGKKRLKWTKWAFAAFF